ncbi:MAG: hypothetical protein KF681_04240 [Bdellovibrionaceae bacterium]|nr:hypothetical protein [Pseudobdellovibrionaceae bacterium]
MKRVNWIWGFAAAAVVVVIWAALSASRIGSGLFGAGRADAMKVEFTSYMSQVRGLQRMELGSIKSYEVLTKTSEFSILWDLVKLPDLVVETRLPVRYVYFVDFKEPFQIDLTGDTVRIQAPALQAGMPAPDISGFEIRVKSGGFMRDKSKAIEDLKSSITPLLMKRAEENKTAVRETARQELANFFSVWLRSREDFGAYKNVSVTFADEPTAPTP